MEQDRTLDPRSSLTTIVTPVQTVPVLLLSVLLSKRYDLYLRCFGGVYVFLDLKSPRFTPSIIPAKRILLSVSGAIQGVRMLKFGDQTDYIYRLYKPREELDTSPIWIVTTLGQIDPKSRLSLHASINRSP